MSVVYVQNLMSRKCSLNGANKGVGPGSHKIIIMPGETAKLEVELWNKLKKNRAVVGLLEAKRIRQINKEMEPVAPTTDKSGDASPDAYPYLCDTADAESPDGKIKHQVTAVETATIVSPDESLGQRRGG